MHRKLLSALAAMPVLCACSAITDLTNNQNGDGSAGQKNSQSIPVLVTPEYDWAATAASNGSSILVGSWHGPLDIPITFPNSKSGALSVELVSADGSSISAPINVGQNQGVGPSVMFDGTNYVVMYADGPFGVASIYAKFITPFGASVREANLIGRGDVSYAVVSGGGKYLFLYDRDDSATFDAHVRLMSSDGTVGPDLRLGAGITTGRTAVFDGTDFAVMYLHAVSATVKEVHMAFVSTSGQMLRDTVFATVQKLSSGGGVGMIGNSLIVAWDEGTVGNAGHVQLMSTSGALQGARYDISSQGRVMTGAFYPSGNNVILEYVDQGLNKIQVFDPSGLPVGSSQQFLADVTDAAQPFVLAQVSGAKFFAALTEKPTTNKDGNWDVFGRFVTLP